MFVSQILGSKTKPATITISPDASIADAAKLLSEHRIGAVIVNKGDASVMGILSERDIVRELGRRGEICLKDKVADLMTQNVKSCGPGDTAVSVLERMTEGRFRHMPVVENDALAGVISIGDVVKARIEEVEHENSALTELIAG